jgi:hypothetical protein
MSLDPKYIIAPALEQYYVDKDTGLPLANGTLEFFSDVNRSTHKPIYTISGTAPNYTYTELPNPLTLNATGSPEDEAGNNIIPYYYPYDEDGNVELYYVVCKSEGDDEQFTREAWPNFIADSPDSNPDQIYNYIPNGQFLAYNNLPEDVVNNIPAGQIRQASTNIAYGRWVYDQFPGSTATDNVQVVEIPAYVSNPTSSPRNQVQIQCFGADPSDGYKIFCIEFEDVNKFSSSTQYYTFAFNAVTYNSSPFNVEIGIFKYYGSGGAPSPSTTTNLVNFTITSTNTLFQIPFIFGANTGTQVGTNNDDYVRIQIELPPNISFGCRMTDFMLIKGNVVITEFPPQTNRDMLSRTLNAPTPDPDGYDIGMPMVLTKNGIIFDHSQVGKIVASIDEQPSFGELSCMGTTTYRTDSYSSDGIPYRRLQRKLVSVNGSANVANLPKFGTGPDYITAYFAGTTNTKFTICTNKRGPQVTTINNGTPFSFFTNVLGTDTDYGFFAAQFDDGTFLWIKCREQGSCANNSSGTAGVVINTIPYPFEGEHIGNVVVNQIVGVEIDSSNTIAPGTYFVVNSPTTKYVIWFQVDASGSQPVVSGSPVYIKIDLLSGYTYVDVAYQICAALNGFQSATITVTAGSTIPPSSYFTFHANGQTYAVWYNLNGTGTAPVVVNAILIPVVYATSNTAANIRQLTVEAINDLYFATPNMQGLGIKGWTESDYYDSNQVFRYSQVPSVLPKGIGTLQFDYGLSYDTPTLSELSQQLLDSTATSLDGTPVREIGPAVSTIPQEYKGTHQTDVRNMYLSYFIKY